MDSIISRPVTDKKKNRWKLFLKSEVLKNKYVYMMALPVIAYYIIFHYAPMYGAVIAFKDYSPGLGIFKSPWVGLQNFKEFIDGPYFVRTIRNTLLINLYSLLWGFPAPIVLALLLNEVKNKAFKSTVQTVTYLPHFISLVVIAGIIKDFTSTNGIINDFIVNFGGTRANLLTKPELFRTIFVGSGIWQELGWNSIIYLAALSSIDSEQYESAKIDGAGRWRQMLNITLPGILPTIVILLILRMGHMFSVGFEKIILLYNSNTYETADVISSFVYRKGLLDFSWSFSTAVNLFNSVLNFTMLIMANWLSRKVNDTSLW